MKKKYLIIIFFLLAIEGIATPSQAPRVPSAGIVERELEKEYEAQPLDIEKKVPETQIDIPEERLNIPDGKKIYICKIQIEGNESISSSELKPLLDLKGGCRVSIKDIYKICKEIENYYQKKEFFLARAYPPPQDIKNNTLIIKVMEGHLGNVKIVGNKYYTSKFIMRYFSYLQHKPLRYDKFLRTLILLNEISDLSAAAIFEKGKKLGEADVIVQIKDKNPIHLFLNGNDYGRYLTTNFRVGGRFDKGSLFFFGDKFSVAEVVGFPIDALYFTDLVYTVPLNAKGSFFELAYLTSRFHVQELKELHLKGFSDIATLKFSHALRRSRFLSLDIFSYFDYKQIKNFTLSERTAFDRLRVLTFGTLLDHNSPGYGRDYLVLRAGFGLPIFDKLHKDSCSRPGASATFFKFNLDYDRLQKLGFDCYMFFHTSGQISPDKLTVPEQIYIGGADSVRGFPLAVALGDSGYYMNLEFRLPPFGLQNTKFLNTQKKWKEIFQFIAFLDHGGTFYNGGKDTFLTGMGLGFIINGLHSLSLTTEVGFPLNHRDNFRKAFFYVKITGQPF